MINRRLLYCLQSLNMLEPFLRGTREGLPTIDYLVRIEANIREPFVHKLYFFIFLNMVNMAEAYDTTSRYGIFRDLFEMGIRGNMLNIIESFLSNRTYQVIMGNILSRLCTNVHMILLCLSEAYSAARSLLLR